MRIISTLTTSAMPTYTPTLGFILHDVARFLRKRFEQNARGLGLTRSQWQVLAFLAPVEGIHQAGLADILEIEAITLVRILDKLESCGLIERRPHPTDRRIWNLFLTEKAHPVLARMRELGDRTRAEALHGLDADTQAVLMQALTVMKKNLVAACDQPPCDQPPSDQPHCDPSPRGQQVDAAIQTKEAEHV